MKRYIIALILFFSLTKDESAQCPNAAFIIPDTVCAGEMIFPQNISTNATNYDWDFSCGDLISVPDVNSLGTLGNAFTNPTGISIVYDGANWFGFVKNLGTSKITRLDFGSSLKNTPTATDIGNPGGLLGSSFGRFGFHKEHGNWYALTTNVAALIKLDFGNSLTNIPSASALPSYGLLNNSRDLFLTMNKDTIYALVANFVSNNISVYKFDSLSGNIINYFNITAVADSGFASGLYSVAAVKDCDQWVALTGGFSDNNVVRLKFNGSIHPKPDADQLGNFGTVNKPTAVHIKSENALWVAYVQNRSNMGLTRIVFPDSMMTQNPQSISLGTFSNLLSNTDALDLATDSSRWFGFGMNKTSNSLINIAFPDSSYAIPMIDTSTSPSVYYSKSGTYYITLTAIDSIQNKSYFHDSIIVKEGPIAGFVSSGICYGQITAFTDTSTSVNNIDSWLWDFGDGDSSSAQNPSHLFTDTGSYYVKLVVSNVNGCSDSTTKILVISPTPSAGFIASDFCSKHNTFFTDTSSISAGSLVSWKWYFGNGDSSLAQNPAYSYDSGGYYNVNLICGSNNGCIDTTMLGIHINVSPQSSFTAASTCKNDSTFLLNTTAIDSGSVTSYAWYFSDGDTSYAQDTSHIFPDTGSYTVSLIAVSDSGCIDTSIQTIDVALPPIPGFSYSPAFVCENSLIVFSDTSKVPGGDTTTAWIWDFGTGDSAYTKSPSYVFSSAGSYNVTLLVQSGTDCDTSITMNLTVNPAPTPAFATSGFCFGDSTLFTDQSVGNIVSWQWDFGDTTVSSDTNTGHVYADTGNYAVSLTIVSNSGCINTTYDTIRIHTLPTASFTFSQACSGSPVTFIDLSTSVDDTISAWIWHFGDPGSGASDTSYFQNPSHIYANAGSYTVEEIITTINGCTDTTTSSLTVLQSPTALFSHDTVCDGTPVNFNDNSTGNITSWYWDFGYSNTSSSQNPIYLFDSAGIYNVLLTITDLNGCADTFSKQVSVNHEPIAGYYIEYPCAQTVATFYDSSKVTNATISMWNWKINTDTFSIQNPVYSFQDTNTYFVSLKVTSDQGCSDSITNLITAHKRPVAGFSFAPLFGVPPLNVSFTNQSLDADSYSWTLESNIFSTDANPSHLFTDTGVFAIKLLALSSYGCRDSILKTIKIMDPLLDVAVIKVTKSFQAGYLNVEADLANLGTRDVFDFDISVSLADGYTIKESWSGYLMSGDIMHYAFSASFEIPSEIEPEFICVEVSNPEGEVDDVPQNNEQCISANNTFLLLDPTPNPVQSQLKIRFVLPSTGRVEVNLYNALGQLTEVLFSGDGNAGLNTLYIDTEKYAKGTYAIVVSFMGSTQVGRFISY